MNCRGLIIGSGIAGLAVALFALRKGITLPIFERKGSSREEQEHLLMIAPNGLLMLEALGLLGQVLEHATKQEGIQFTDRGMKVLMRLDCVKLARTNRFPIVAIKRRDLHEILIRSLESLGGSIMHDREVERVENGVDGVHVHLRGERAPLEAEYAIAADGIGSRLRRALFPSSELRYLGIRSWLGVSPTPLARKYYGKMFEMWGEGSRFAILSLDGESVYWVALERQQVYAPTHEPIPDDTLPRLCRLYAEYHPDVGTILCSSDDSQLRRNNFGTVTGLRCYYVGRVCLMGDAAHGMSPNMGQGASLALEDAYWLVEQLASRATVADAFARYDRTRRPRAREMQNLANGMNITFQPEGRVASLLRDRVCGLVPQALTQLRMSRLYRIPFDIR